LRDCPTKLTTRSSRRSTVRKPSAFQSSDFRFQILDFRFAGGIYCGQSKIKNQKSEIL
jgi:hypothetical protein